ncbi:MAG: hypothetical protein WCD44_02185, partial [Candidatus Babeliales bacterium]
MKNLLKNLFFSIILISISSFAMEIENIQNNFFNAIDEGDLEAIEKIVAANSNIINAKDKEGHTSLHFAAQHSHT